MSVPSPLEAARAPASVLLVGPLPPPSGGMANQTRQLARLLEQDGCRVTVVQTNAPYRPAWVGRVRVVRAFFRLVPYLRALWRALCDVEVVHVMANSGWAWHLFAAPAIRIAHTRGKPVIVNYRGGGAEAFLARHSFLTIPTLRRACQIVVPSAFLERVFRTYGIATEIVPNIVDLARFYPAERPPAVPHLIVARNLEDIYDIPTALRAFHHVRGRYPSARLTVVGSGPARTSLERIVDDFGIAAAVMFTGRLDNERMGDLYRSTDLALNPSRVDNMPNSLLEAMASGVPIVSTNAGGIPDMVEDGKTALLVPVGDAEAMAAAALRVLDDAELARSLRAAGIEAAQRYTWTAVRSQLYAMYEKVMLAPASRPSSGGQREPARSAR